MRAIHKYQMPVLEKFNLSLPKDAEIVRVSDIGGMFWLWAIIDTDAPFEIRHFRGFKTGAEIPSKTDRVTYDYLGFCAVYVQMELGLYMFEERFDVR